MNQRTLFAGGLLMLISSSICCYFAAAFAQFMGVLVLPVDSQPTSLGELRSASLFATLFAVGIAVCCFSFVPRTGASLIRLSTFVLLGIAGIVTVVSAGISFVSAVSLTASFRDIASQSQTPVESDLREAITNSVVLFRYSSVGCIVASALVVLAALAAGRKVSSEKQSSSTMVFGAFFGLACVLALAAFALHSSISSSSQAIASMFGPDRAMASASALAGQIMPILGSIQMTFILLAALGGILVVISLVAWSGFWGFGSKCEIEPDAG